MIRLFGFKVNMAKTALERVKDYQARHPERVREQRQRYKATHQDQISEYRKKYYYDVYSKTRKEKVQCVCGRSCAKRHLHDHQQTKLHQKRLNIINSVVVYKDYKMMVVGDFIEFFA